MNDSVIRLTRPGDLTALALLDLQSYQYPLDLTEWRELVNQSGKPTEPKVIVAEVYRKPAGFAMWQEINVDVARVIRLGVIPKRRNLGLGRLLMERCIDHSKIEKKNILRLVIPDIHCKPGDLDDVSGFLSRVHFHATGEVITEHCKMYGDWRDGYVFERNIVHD